VTRGPTVALALFLLASDAHAKSRGDDCPAAAIAPGPGSLEPFRAPAPKALELNAAGKIPYRQGKWDEARAQYRAALAADPEFLAPQLNIACSFVRQERFGEATAGVLALLDRAYVPWAREIREAADLGALKVRPEWKEIERAMAASAAKWGTELDKSEVFVARSRPPLRVPDGPGVFLLNPQQEVWAYTPRTGRYRQLTTEDGHVVALARFANRIAYVTAEKLVRGATASDVALRGVVLHELTLATVSASPPVRVEGDVRVLTIFADLSIGLPEGRRERVYRNDGHGSLVPAPRTRTAGRLAVSLTGTGASDGFVNRPCLPKAAAAGGGFGFAGLSLP
jgi:hypothetical protein